AFFRAASNTHDPAALQLANLPNRCAYGAGGGGDNQRFALFRLGELSLVGTVNLDMRSLWLNFEITLVIDDTGFGADLAAVQDDY
ncbi:hypothetical protein MJN47_30510, partial [Salmonella enterica subsp. enterica serovar Lubbock]|nr:hypothetical protein [Salmonella enterica subsp. enterica serovar Lubbock]